MTLIDILALIEHMTGEGLDRTDAIEATLSICTEYEIQVYADWLKG